MQNKPLANSWYEVYMSGFYDLSHFFIQCMSSLRIFVTSNIA